MTDLIPLSRAHCIPRHGAEHRLGEAQIRELHHQVPEWKVADDSGSISRTYGFDNYYRTMAFVNAVAMVAHSEDHHPDLNVHYDRCVIHYNTHDVGGLSENDFICAAKVDALADAFR